MGEERILRGELIYTFNYLGSTLLLDDAFWFSMKALATAARQPWRGSRELVNEVARASPIQGHHRLTAMGPGASGCSSEGCRWVFSSLSPKTSVMLNPRPVNLQPAVVSRRLSTKEGNKAMREGGSWTCSVEQGGVGACRVQAANLCQIPGNWGVMAITTPFLLFPNHEFNFI